MPRLHPPAPGQPHRSRADDDGFVEAVGERVALLGRDRFEVWMWPLLLVEDLAVEVRRDGALVPPAPRRVHVVPEGLALEWRHEGFTLWLEAFATPRERGLVLLVSVDGDLDLEVALAFRPAFRPMWPAGLGGQISGRDDETGALLLTEELGRFAALVGAPEAEPVEVSADRGVREAVRLRLPISAVRAAKGPVPVLVAGAQVAPPPLSEEARRGGAESAAGTFRARAAVEAARALYRELGRTWPDVLAASRARWRAFLDRTADLETDDPALDEAFRWSKIAIERAWVDVDGAGRSLVAGLGPSHGGDRPGFAWLFSGDALTAVRALSALGDFEGCRAILRWCASTQRADGKIAHEVTLSAGLCDWFEDYPYAFYKGQCTPGFVAVLGAYVSFSDDRELARELWPAVERAVAWCESTCDEKGRMRVPAAGIAAVEAGPLAGRIETEVYLLGIWRSARRAAIALARELGDQPREREYVARWNDLEEPGLSAFVDPATGRLAFALLRDGELVRDLTAYTALPLSREADPSGSVGTARVLDQNRPELMTDWGARMFATTSAVYDPEHYNTGSVFPYLTNFNQLALFAAGYADAAWQVLRSQVALDGFGGLGYLPEFLAGDRARLLPRAVPHQVFSQTTVLQGVLFGLLGLRREGGRVLLRPARVLGLDRLRLRGLALGTSRADVELAWSRDPEGSSLRARVAGEQAHRVACEPALPPLSRVSSVTRDEAPGAVEFRVRFRSGPSLRFPADVVRDAPSRHPRLVDQELTGESLAWRIAGRAGTTTELPFACDFPISLEGARRRGDHLVLTFPAARDDRSEDGETWTETTVRITATDA